MYTKKQSSGDSIALGDPRSMYVKDWHFSYSSWEKVTKKTKQLSHTTSLLAFIFVKIFAQTFSSKKMMKHEKSILSSCNLSWSS